MGRKVWTRQAKMTAEEVRCLGLGADIWVEYEFNGKMHIEGHRKIIGGAANGKPAKVYGLEGRDFVYCDDPFAPDSEGGVNHIYRTEEVEEFAMDTEAKVLKELGEGLGFAEYESQLPCDSHQFTTLSIGGNEAELEVTEFGQTKRFKITVEEIK